MLVRLGGTPEDLASRQQAEVLAERASKLDLQTLSGELGVGRLLLADIIEQLARPGRDPRDDLPKPFFKKGVLKLEDLELGMELLGSVLNVVDFGAFVDIGMHDSGLVHISQLSNRYVRDPHDVVSVGQIVKVWVLELDKARRRVALTMISPAQQLEQQQQQRQQETSRGDGRQREGGGNSRSRRDGARQQTRGTDSQAGQPVAGQSGGQSSSDVQGRGRQPRPSQPSRGRDSRPAREQQPRTYTAITSNKPAAPITKAMKEGKEPLRTFGDLKQFFEKPAAVPPPEVSDPKENPPAAGAG